MALPEAWKDVPDYEGYYQASDWGRVQSVDREIVYSTGQRRSLRGRILSAVRDTNGYLTVDFYVNGQRTKQLVHQLVLKVFVGPRPDGYESCHTDGCRSNNYLENLHWGTKSENLRDRHQHSYKGVLLKCVQRSDGVIFDSLRQAAKHTNVSHTSIQQAMAERRECRGYKWEYV